MAAREVQGRPAESCITQPRSFPQPRCGQWVAQSYRSSELRAVPWPLNQGSRKVMVTLARAVLVEDGAADRMRGQEVSDKWRLGRAG